MPDQPTTRARINRANAQHSTGPTSPEGKSKSSLNAVKTGLTGRTVLLPAEDADAYRDHVLAYLHEFSPVGPRETALVQALADNAWRLERIPVLEMNIYALGHMQFAPQFAQQEPAQRQGFLQVRTFLAYEKQFRNLQIQEGRLQSQRAKDTSELQQLQQIRKAKENAALEAAAQLYLSAKQQNKPFQPADHGFEFSTAQIEFFIQLNGRKAGAAERARSTRSCQSPKNIPAAA